MSWIPLSRREDPSASQEEPYEGVPTWLENSLLDWVESEFLVYRHEGFGPTFDRAKLRSVERALRAPGLGQVPDRAIPKNAWNELKFVLRADDTLFLDTVDYLVGNVYQGVHRLESLERILSEAGSVWSVSDGEAPYRLERRLDPTVKQAAISAASANDRAAEHLASAWQSLYGRTPSPSQGYSDAVRAVETIAKPIITPKDSSATLGKMIGAMRDAPMKWIVVLETGNDPVGGVADMMNLLWTAQRDRHGTNDPTVPLNVSTEEARAAFHLAVLLVQWFREGVIRRL